MDQTNDGGPAFPVALLPGMSLRDYFAGQALAGIMANPERHGHQVHAEDEFFIAEDAYILADAMIALRDKERE